ncbi:uncharacterized protein LOC127278675 [Leptopilina boulardi]|uniref:uncharacterized protein LOC127278675 n=1 Tax=Leptopilina boulardi TaxID=63433 RepID=UPI0021F5E0B6|nr:uncharacterized protein LOC127278675 [Leptopilina boulardi]
MDLLNFLNTLQIIHIITLYTCINGDGSILQSQHMPSKLNETLNVTESTKEQLIRKKEIERLTDLEMDEPELFYNLTHPNSFPKNCTNLKQKMRHLYNSTNNSLSRKLWFNFVLNKSINYYRKRNLSSSLRFEDYFAIRYYSIKGNHEMRFDTDISRRMKNALFSVAITQSSDPNEKIAFKLFRGQTKPTTWFNKKFNETTKELEWDAMTETTSTRIEAQLNAGDGKFSDVYNEMTEGVYEINFSKPYLSANIKDYIYFNENNVTVLLPESKFFINDTDFYKESETNDYYRFWSQRNSPSNQLLTIKMTYNDENMDLFHQQKRVMSKLKKLRETGTQFYVC